MFFLWLVMWWCLLRLGMLVRMLRICCLSCCMWLILMLKLYSVVCFILMKLIRLVRWVIMFWLFVMFLVKVCSKFCWRCLRVWLLMFFCKVGESIWSSSIFRLICWIFFLFVVVCLLVLRILFVSDWVEEWLDLVRIWDCGRLEIWLICFWRWWVMMCLSLDWF